MSVAYPVVKTNKLPDVEAGVYLAMLREYGHDRGICHGYENGIQNMLYVMRNKVYYLGKRDNEDVTFQWQDVQTIEPTIPTITILERGSGTHGLTIIATAVLKWGARVTIIDQVNLGMIPVMLGSIHDPESRNRNDLLLYGWDINEPSAVFLVGGKKRTFNQQENLSSNAILCYYNDLKLDPKSLVASLTTESRYGLTAMYTIHFVSRIIRFSNFRGFAKNKDSIDVLDCFNLLGYDDNKDGPLADYIVQFTRPEWRDKIRSALSPSLAMYYSHRRSPGQIALVIKRIRDENFTDIDINRYIPILRNDLYSHIQSDKVGIIAKQATLARQVVRLVEVDLGLVSHDDRNSYRNERLKGPGPAMFHLFNLTMETLLTQAFFPNYSVNHTVDKLRALLQSRPITQDYEHSFEKSWGLKGGRSLKSSNFVETLKDEQFILQHTHVDKVVRGRDPNSRNFPIRAMQPSQPPFIDYSETPENGNVGLSNIKTSGSYISQHHDATHIIDLIHKSVIDNEKMVQWGNFTRDLEGHRNAILVINGILQGVCNGKQSRDRLVKLRRIGVIPRDTEVSYGYEDGYVYVKCDAGRLLIPVFVVGNDSDGYPQLMLEKNNILDDIASGNIEHDDHVLVQWRNAGFIDLIDPFEADREYVCTGPKEMKTLIDDVRKLRDQTDALERELLFDPIPVRYVSMNDEYTIVDKKTRDDEILQHMVSINKLMRVSIDERRNIDTEIMELSDNKNQASYNDQFQSLRGIRDRITRMITKYAARIRTNIDIHNTTKPLTRDDVALIIERIRSELSIATKRCKFTYILPDPMMMVGITSSLLQLHNHNPGPRQTFGCKMIKQTMVLSSHSQRWLPVACKYGVMNARGPVETVTYEHIGTDIHATGIPFVMALFAGQNVVEDMIVISKSLAESGAGSCVISKLINKKIPNVEVKSMKGNAVVTTRVTNKLPKEITDHKRKGVFDNLGADGVIIPGSVLKNGDCVIGAYTETIFPDGPPQYIDRSRYVKRNKTGIVKDILHVRESDGNTVLRIHINEYSIPERGDKFGNVHAQKATVGDIFEQWNMPQSMTDGTTLAAYVDTHCFPSRMTVAFLIEMLLGKAHALTGVRYDGTPFHDHMSIEEAGDVLEQYGFKRSGEEEYYFPKTGKILKAQLFSGVCQYFPLTHKAEGKLQNRYIGKNNSHTHQSVTGMENDGGQRMGPMEYDVQHTYGSSDTIVQWSTRYADYFKLYTCSSCDTQIFPMRDPTSSRINFRCTMCQTTVKKVNYAVSNVSQQCLYKYGLVMGYNMTYILKPKPSLYLPNMI